MSGFDLSNLLPFYLDETDEQIAGLNEMLLKLEQAPGDEKALREAFRLVHSIKGASTVMGFGQVKELTHHLETFFDQIRSGKRELDRPFLDLCFRCLDALRDYHADLRAKGESPVDLTGLTTLVIEHLHRTEAGEAAPAVSPPPTSIAAESETASEELRAAPPTAVTSAAAETAPPPAPAAAPSAPPEELIDPAGLVSVTVRFEEGIPWPDMKARLVVSRLASKGRVVSTEPPVERLEEVAALTTFTVTIAAEADISELHELADVEGVIDINVVTSPIKEPEPAPTPAPAPEPAAAPPPPEPVESRPVPEPVAPAAEPPRVPTAPAATAEAGKPRVVETLRVDVDRLDYLMNLAGELVINKARFVEIARGLEDVFRGSNVDLLANDTLERFEAIIRGVEGEEGRGATGSADLRAAQVRRLRENFRAILDELDQVRQARERLNAMEEAIHHLSRVSDGIQKGVLETRMVPIGPLFDRFQRVVRDLRVHSNKEVTLKIEGEKTELDKRMIDELADPLVHMVRNAVDHGLELPAAREAAGKPRAGRVVLAASHRGNSVVITVSDDGRGIDCNRVRKKAVAKGLLSEDEARRLSDRQVIPFIFHPGLSTAEAVTDVSGRGVGMDIVKSRIEALNGGLDVRTELGQGTTFTIRLPLTLAIMPVLYVKQDAEVYAIPLDHLNEIVEVRQDQIYCVHGRSTIEVRGRIISLVRLHDLLCAGAIPAEDRLKDERGGNAKHTVVVVSDGEATIGLVVDHLLGMQEAVLKSLEKNFRPVPGLSGASILGDGRVSLILDVDAMIQMASCEPAQTAG